MKDNKLTKLAIKKHTTSVYQCADLIIQEHGIYRFNFNKETVKEIIGNMIKSITGKYPPDLALELGAAYVFITEEEKTENSLLTVSESY
jgi:hypothetical protein